MTDIAQPLMLPNPLPRPARTHRRVARVTAVAVAVALVAGVGWWLTHPGALREAGNRVTISAVAGETVNIGELAFGEREVTVSSVTPRVVENSAGADLHVALCYPRPDTKIGAGRWSLAADCTRVEDVAGQRLAVGDAEAPYLVLVIDPRTPGQVLVDGFDVSYRDGVRFGDQHTGVTVDVRVGA